MKLCLDCKQRAELWLMVTWSCV